MKILKSLMLGSAVMAAAITADAQDPNFHIYLCIGQSNMEGNARVEQMDRKDVPARFKVMSAVDFNNPKRTKGEWYVAVPPLVREHTGLTPADYFGRTMVDNLPENVTVGVIPVAVGGCKIEHLSKDYDPASVASEAEWFQGFMKAYDNKPYDRLVECAKKAQKDGVIKGILLHQGESNNGDKQWPAKVKKVYDDLLADLGLEPNSIPLIAGEVVSSEKGGICGGHNAIINTLPETLPTAHVVSSAGLPQRGDGLHFTAYGYRELGSRYAKEMLKTMGIDDPKLNYSAEAMFKPDTYKLSSPDGKTVVTVSDNGMNITYSVAYDGKEFLLSSPLGLMTNIGDYTTGLDITAASGVKEVSDNYSLSNIKNNKVNYLANEETFTVSQCGVPVFDIQMRVSDNNVAFRYKILPKGGTLAAVVNSEATGFNFPEGTTTFLCPQMNPMTGFARTAPSYETNYDVDDTMGKNGWGNGYTFPCLFKNGDNGWTLISETGIAGDYCGSHLANKKDGNYAIAYPIAAENNGFGSTGAQIALPGFTPWRTVTVGSDLAPIAETTIPFDLVEQLYEPSKNYDYGKGSWSWIIKMDPSCNFEEQKKYIDFSAAMGWDTVLVDALWDTQIGYDGIEKLAKYGKEKGVDLYLWYNSNGNWNDAPQGPRGIMNDIVKRRKDMAWMQKNGIRGIKVDFFGGDKQETMRLYHDILADANDHGILVIFHGCTLPRGWDRMYPNYAASEAVLASENLHFSQGMCDAEAKNACIHPLVRNAVGSMDFGGSTLNKWYNANNEPNRGSQRKTSDVFALATAVLFQSPVQHFAMAPNNLEDAPAWAVDFMKEVPTTWDEVKFIDGYPSKYVIMARRSGDKWYVAGINAQEEPLTVNLPVLTGADGSNVKLYSDDKSLTGNVKYIKADKKGNVKVTIPTNGGALAVMDIKK